MSYFLDGIILYYNLKLVIIFNLNNGNNNCVFMLTKPFIGWIGIPVLPLNTLHSYPEVNFGHLFFNFPTADGTSCSSHLGQSNHGSYFLYTSYPVRNDRREWRYWPYVLSLYQEERCGRGKELLGFFQSSVLRKGRTLFDRKDKSNEALGECLGWVSHCLHEFKGTGYLWKLFVLFR